ncbi:MAG TPA: GPR1/FUN34/YaaH family transporter [Rhodanobacteraceae bacterium]
MRKTANAAGLGYGAFALTLWMNSMPQAGWFGTSAHYALLATLTAVLGGGVLGLAGILQWCRGNTIDTLLFIGFAAYWVIAALVLVPYGPAHVAAASGFLGWYDLVWALLAFCVWIAAWYAGVGRMLFALGVCASLLATAIGHWTGISGAAELGGYFGLVTAVVGIYICAATLINAARGSMVLPLGPSGSDPQSGPPA